MEIELKRVAKKETYTIGKLSIDGVYQCDTLEDKVRILPEVCPNTPKGIDCKCSGKVWGETAIPSGRYKIEIIYSTRFKKKLPHLINVPHFIGILIHPGNTAIDTHGCLLVGKNNIIGKVTDSVNTFNKIFEVISTESKEIWITVC